MSELTLEVSPRDERGKNAARRLRSAGHVPAVVYGGANEAIAIRVPNRNVQALLREGGDNAVFLLRLAGTKQSRHAMIRDIQYDALTGGLRHIDFLRIDMTEKVRVRVPIELIGTPIGVRTEGGILDFVTRDIELECLPGNIPQSLELNVEDVHVGQHLEVGALTVSDDVEILEEENRVLVAVNVILEPEVEEGEVDEEGLIEATEDEPEVASRGKEDDEGDEG